MAGRRRGGTGMYSWAYTIRLLYALGGSADIGGAPPADRRPPRAPRPVMQQLFTARATHILSELSQILGVSLDLVRHVTTRASTAATSATRTSGLPREPAASAIAASAADRVGDASGGRAGGTRPTPCGGSAAAAAACRALAGSGNTTMFCDGRSASDAGDDVCAGGTTAHRW